MIFSHSTPVTPSTNGVPNNQAELQQYRSADAATPFSDLEEKVMFFQIAYPNFSVVPLIPASVQIQPTLTKEQKKEVQERLTELTKIFKDYPPIRDTFTGMAFMLQNPELMQMFLNASPSHNNGLSLANSSHSVQMQALQLLRLFETFVRSFNMSDLLQSMGEVPSAVTTQGSAQLENLYKLLGHDLSFAFFLQGVVFGLQLQQSNPPQATKKAPNPITEVGGMLLAAKGSIIKQLGKTADVIFENVKDTNDMVQKYTALLKNVPGIGNAVEPAQKFINTILDSVHIVIGDTAESVGDALQSQGRQPLRRQGTSFANTKT